MFNSEECGQQKFELQRKKGMSWSTDQGKILWKGGHKGISLYNEFFFGWKENSRALSRGQGGNILGELTLSHRKWACLPLTLYVSLLSYPAPRRSGKDWRSKEEMGVAGITYINTTVFAIQHASILITCWSVGMKLCQRKFVLNKETRKVEVNQQNKSGLPKLHCPLLPPTTRPILGKTALFYPFPSNFGD